MISFRDLSIPKKIVAIIMVISAAALLLSSFALMAYDFSTTRQELSTSANVFAHVVAFNTAAAVSFNDIVEAEETLNSLRAEPSIVAACIYTNERLLATYVVPPAAKCSDRPIENLSEPGVVLASSPVELNGKNIGTIQIRATLAPAYAQLRSKVAITVAILMIAGLFAFVLSSRLHKLVSEPILSLVNAAHEVSRRKDYSVRAVKKNADELGVLVDAFNEMLAQIQHREQELQKRTAELVQAGRMKDEFLATLSHELRTPLNSILGWAVLVQQGQLPKEREKSAIEAIERNARVQARLIEDLLDVSRIISGKFTLDPSVVGLNQVVESAIEVVRPAAETKHITIEFDRPATPIRVTGDAARLQQAVWNLLSNAVKFTGDQGRVIIRTEKTEHDTRISVTDNGIGIPEEFLPYVFDRFRQADGSSTRKHGGLGLGLAIVRHIVEMHGGSIRAESRGRGHGTTFTIQLPAPVSDEQAAERLSRRHG
jgi:signal transduction histidine kinase